MKNNLHVEISKCKQTGRFRIHLGNTEWIYFENKTAAIKYVYGLKKLVKDCLYMLSSVQSELYRNYQNIWISLSGFDNRKMNEKLVFFDERKTYVFSDFSSGNTVFALQNLERCFVIVEETALSQRDWAQKNKETSLKNSIYAQLRLIDTVFKDFEKEKLNLEISLKARGKKFQIVKRLNTNYNAS
ncbi:MAG: hypothetical protein COB60_12530 [Flavobacteriaceae bacterium]|nr:MAG: hypothetical protein COB60_12530 [Flavobacteriaceae bacterium]